MNKKSLLISGLLLCFAGAVNAQFENRTITVNVYDKGELIVPYTSKYKVQVRHNFSKLLAVKPTEPIWHGVDQSAAINFRLMYNNMPYSLKITDTTTGKVMTLHSQLSFDSLPFTPGDYTITTPFVHLFNIKPAKGVKLPGADLAKFKDDSKQQYAEHTDELYTGRNYTLLTHLQKADKVIAYAQFYNLMWVRDNNNGKWQQVELQDKRVKDIYELDENSYYICTMPIGGSYINSVTINYENAVKVIDFPEVADYAALNVKVFNEDSVCCIYVKTSEAPSTFALYTTGNGGKSWNKRYVNLRRVTEVPQHLFLQYFLDGDNRIAYTSGSYIVQYDENGKLARPQEKDYDPEQDSLLCYVNDYSYIKSSLVLNKGKLYYTSNRYKGIYAPYIKFNKQVGVIVNKDYILVSKNGGIQWKYYPLSYYEERVSTVEEIPSVLNADILNKIPIQDAALLNDNTLIIRSGSRFLSVNINNLPG